MLFKGGAERTEKLNSVTAFRGNNSDRVKPFYIESSGSLAFISPSFLHALCF
jgi:hypothetical protein